MPSNKVTDNKCHLANYQIRNYNSKDFQQLIDIYTDVGFLIYKYTINLANRIDQHGIFVAEDVDSGKYGKDNGKF